MIQKLRWVKWAFIIGMIGFFPLARADVVNVRQELVAPGGADRIEVTTFLAENEEDRQKIVEELEKILAADSAANPNLEIHFEAVLPEAGRSPNAVGDPGADIDVEVENSLRKLAGETPLVRRRIPAETLSRIQSKFESFFAKNYRMVFALVRGGINAGVTTWSLMASNNIPFPLAVAAGGLTGAMSGGLQYWNKNMQGYLTSTALSEMIPKSLIQRGVKKIEPFFRWYVLEVGFITTLQVALTAMGHGPDAPLLNTFSHTLVTAAAAVGAQGSWEVGLSEATKRSLKTTRSPKLKLRIQMRADLLTLAISAISVGAMVGKLSGVGAADWVFGGMAVTGAIYYWKFVPAEQQCKKFLRKSRPAKSDEEISEPIAFLSTDEDRYFWIAGTQAVVLPPMVS